jgi:DNA polymerase
MDVAASDELIGELLDLTRRLRGQLARHAALGTWAAPGGASARMSGAEAQADPEDAGSALGALSETPPGVPDQAAELAAAHGATAIAPAGPGDAVAGARAAAAELRHGTEVAPGLHAGPRSRDLDSAAAVSPRDLHVGAPEPGGDAPVVLGRRTLPQIRTELGDCTRCKLHSTRHSIVFGVGAPDTPLMFVGEAPGEQEDRRGEPFVGPAGQLLDKMIEAMGWTRSAVYIANTTKCRPPGNRNPQPDELAQCMPFLHGQIAAIAPRIIVALGRPASNQLLGTDAPISALRGRFHDYALPSGGVRLKVMPTFHPAYLLRDPSKKRTAWEDLKLVMAELERLGIAPPAAPRG